MSTLSVPLNEKLEKGINHLVASGVYENKAEVGRKGIELLMEEEAIKDVLLAEQEVSDGKLLSGDLDELAEKIA